MASNSAEPTSSYKYFEGSSRCPALVRLSRTSAENSDTCRMGSEAVSMESPGLECLCLKASPLVYWFPLSPYLSARLGAASRHPTRAIFLLLLKTENQRLKTLSPRRNGRLRRRTDNAAGTNFGTTAAACTPRCAASHPS